MKAASMRRVVHLFLGLLVSAASAASAADDKNSAAATDEARLSAREVVLSIAASTNAAAGGTQVLGAVLIAAPPARVWAAWKDWESVSAFVPDLRYYKTVHVIRPENDAGEREALIEGKQDVGCFSARFTLHVRFDRAAWRQEWHLLTRDEAQSWRRQEVPVKDASWSIRRIEGSGCLEPREDGRKTVLRYAPRLETALLTPGFLERRAAERSLRAFLAGMRDRVEAAQSKGEPVSR